ncbi:PAS/PAC sensor hybrid histidine kinase [Chthoniobacter flavus Ellin428]|uniref:histidine kinase n=1 Tax=Chthoniobacter flavus Ellin428 TaxID=497964 RepID=B4CYZ9_9BACT|nr:PAS domain-containing protein [Chthoniobacter flavus]EDY20690.1 PAS/PAC sensor hybrid histidine kinase [Chthoniobacter flavus Ellin428]TCO89588.1 PAS domain S-box-containing protein [Chthoniobacter flavus]
MSQPDPHQGSFDALLWRALVFDHIYEALVVTAEDDTILDWNAGAERSFGWSRGEVLGQPLHAVHRPMAASGTDGTLGAIVQQVGRWNGTVQFVRKDGTAAMCEVVGIPLLDSDGNTRGTLFLHAEPVAPESAAVEEEPILEATPTTLAVNQQLRDERFLLRKLIDAVPDPIFCKDREGRYLLRNAADLKMFEVPNQGPAIGHDVFELPGLKAHADIYYADDMEVVKTGKAVINREEPFETPMGERGWFLTSKFPLQDESGEVIGLVGIARNVTDVKRATEELRAAQLRLIDHVENSPLAVVEWGPDFRVTRWAGQAEHMFGWRADEVVGKHLGDWPFVYPDEMERVGEIVQRLLDGTDYRNTCQYRNLTKLGRILHCSWQNSVLHDVAGKTVSILSLVQDVTDRVLAEQLNKKATTEKQLLERKLQESQKLESLGVLAGGIAHDFNNLLTGVLGNASLARMDLPEDSPVQPYLQQIEAAAARAADLCKQMLAYSGKGRFVVNRLDINALIEDTTRLLQVSISKRAVMKFNLSPGLPVVLGDATQLRQVVMNLVINASEAISDKSGFIGITTGLTRADRAYLSGAFFARDLPEGDYVSLEISDNGGGMSQEVLEKIFDPFFTTKFTGRGLGLAAVLGIVRGHNGALKVFSEEGWGTTFKILLPCAEGVAEELTAAMPGTEGWTGSGRVLVVDDEETVRVTTARMLEACGFTTKLADHGRTGVEEFSADPDGYTLIMLDLTMPHMDGDEAFRLIRELRPSARVLLMSGFNEQEAIARFTGKGLAGFIQKPFTFPTLREKLQEIFPAQPAAV